jgi:nucleotide-binding universal stress UspA family protein
VWLIKPRKSPTYRTILAAVDVDDGYPPQELETRGALNRQVLELATALALAESAELHIVNVWEVVGESMMRGSAFLSTPEETVNNWVEQAKQHHAESLDDLIREVSASVGADALEYLDQKTHLVKGSARDEIPALAERLDADLIVMGTVARTGVLGFIMGNTAETILNRIDCSVLALKPPGFESPVA